MTESQLYAMPFLGQSCLPPIVRPQRRWNEQTFLAVTPVGARLRSDIQGLAPRIRRDDIWRFCLLQGSRRWMQFECARANGGHQLCVIRSTDEPSTLAANLNSGQLAALAPTDHWNHRPCVDSQYRDSTLSFQPLEEIVSPIRTLACPCGQGQ